MLNKLKLKSEFSRNVLTLMTGTTIAQAIPIAISPILTRIYTPEDFGMFALYISIVSFISIIITGRYEMAIVLPSHDEEAINILALSVLIMSTIIIFVTLLLLLFKNEILSLLNAQSIGNLIYLVPFSLLLAGLNQIFNYWSNRKKYFQTISSTQIKQSLTIGIVQPSFGYFSIYGGLIIGNMLGRLIAAFFYLDKFMKNDKDKLANIKKDIIITQMKKYKDFPMINSLHALSEIMRISGSVMLISTFFGSTVLGFYSFGLRILQVPMGIIGSALGQIFYQKFSILHNEGKALYPYVNRIVLMLFCLALVIFVILYFILPDLFSLVFGEGWRMSGEYSRLLIPYLFMSFLLAPISDLFIILKRQKFFFYFSLLGNITTLFIIYVGFLFHLRFQKILLYISFELAILYALFLLYLLKILYIQWINHTK